MSIENLFGGIVPSGSGGQIQGTGGDPTKIGIMGNPKTRIKAKMVLPTEISAAQSIKQSQELGQLDAEVELAKDISAKQGQQLDKLLELQRINTDFSKKVMNVDQSLRTIEAGHGRSVAQFQLGAAETQASFDGYQQIYNMGSEIFG